MAARLADLGSSPEKREFESHFVDSNSLTEGLSPDSHPYSPSDPNNGTANRREARSILKMPLEHTL
jgi:hypothetical protein